MSGICGIYMIKHKATGRQYIGQSSDIHRRFVEHTYDSAKLRIDKSIKKYGHRCFEFWILFECAPEKLNEEEEKIIALYNTYHDKDHYNESPGKAPDFRKDYYRIAKSGNPRGKQSYTLRGKNCKWVKSSYDYNYLNELLIKLNEGILSEDDIINKQYRVIKDGKRDNKQLYSIKNPQGKKIKQSVDKLKLEKLVLTLNEGNVTEEDILNKVKDYKIVKNGYCNSRQRYSIKNPEGKVITSSSDKFKLEYLMYELKEGGFLDDDLRNI